MLVCVICGQEVLADSDMKTHLLLSHLESSMSCPLCSLSGVSYDELRFHVETAHSDSGIRPLGAKGQTFPRLSGGASNDRTEGVPADCHRNSKSQQTSQPHMANPTSHPLPAPAGTLRSHKAIKESLGHREEPVHTKQKHSSSTRTESLIPQLTEATFSCPMCAVECSDWLLLQEHVELHLQEQAADEGGCWECPLCALVCSDSASLQGHVDSHLDFSTTTEGSGSDLQLARRLQEEEEQQRKVREARREAEEFRKLQRQFGLDGRGGYRRQLEQNLERAVSCGQMVPVEFHRKRAEMMESLASGVDDGRTRTSGLMEALYQYFLKAGSDIVHVWLSAETDHYSCSEGDQGWGCGYRNFQMLLSSLHRMGTYRGCFTGGATVPSIPRVQALIEEAWREGIDPQGASHFNSRLQGSRAWIGATEIYSLLTSIKVRARIVDFHQPTGPGNTHPSLFEWVKKYFSESASRGARLPPRVARTTQPPIYLQHQGHSRSIVGVEQKKNGSLCLLTFDPGCPSGDMRKLLQRDVTWASVRPLRKHPNSLKHKQYQIVAIEGALSPGEKQAQITTSRTLRAERIP